jgi:hypothetical protein
MNPISRPPVLLTSSSLIGLSEGLTRSQGGAKWFLSFIFFLIGSPLGCPKSEVSPSGLLAFSYQVRWI